MFRPDLVSKDLATSRLLVVEIQESIPAQDREFFMQQLRQYAEGLGMPKTVYYVLVDNERIRIYQDAEPEPRLLNEFNTRETLQPYIGADYSGVMSEFLMSGMTMAWLRDLALHWKESNPPGSSEIEPGIVKLVEQAGVHVESVP